jgi:spore germination protein YaaH
MAYYYPPDPTSLESLRANLPHLDIVAPHWLEVNEAGRVDGDQRAEVVTLLRSSRALVLPSVVVSNAAAAHQVVAEPRVRAAAISGLVAAAERWDGLALDFEGLDPEDRADLTSFIWELGAALRAAGKLYLVALPAKSSDVRTGWSGAYDYPAIAGAADLFLVMAYGWRTSSSRDPGSTAPMPWVEASIQYAVQELTADRVLLGVAFYGYDWNVSQGPPARALRHRDTQQLIDRYGAEPAFRPDVGSATFSYVAAGEAHEVWYEDARSLNAKLGLVSAFGLRGTGAWRLGQEDPGSWLSWNSRLAPTAGPQGAAPNGATGGSVAPPSPNTSSSPGPGTVGSGSRAQSGWVPTLWSGGGESVELNVTNPNPAPATIIVSLLLDDGSRVRLSRLVGAGERASIELGSDLTADAALSYASSVPVGVDVVTRRPDGALTTMATVEPSSRWVFPDAQAGTSVGTAVAIVNPHAEGTRVALRARAESGATVWEHDVQLEGGRRAVVQVPADRGNLFWLEVTSDVGIAAARQTRFPGGAQVDTGLSPAREWVVPKANLGEAWESYVVVANPGPVPANLRLRWKVDGRDVDERVANISAMGRISVTPSDAVVRVPADAEIVADQPVAVVRSAYERSGVGTSTQPGTPR